MRTSINDVRAAFLWLTRAVEDAGLTRDVSNYDPTTGETVTATLSASDLRLEEGSPTYGRAFRVVLVGPFGAHYNLMPGVPEYLGWSKDEAVLMLRTSSQIIRELAPYSDHIDAARAALARYDEAVEGDSGDEEHEAAFDVVGALRAIVERT